MRFIKIAAACSSVALLAACETSNFYGEAGIGAGHESFGMAYGNNELVQSAEYQRGDYIGEVQTAFARDVRVERRRPREPPEPRRAARERAHASAVWQAALLRAAQRRRAR